jgi:hypothetical protein
VEESLRAALTFRTVYYSTQIDEMPMNVADLLA